jgi:hypothetical protein
MEGITNVGEYAKGLAKAMELTWENIAVIRKHLRTYL